MADIPIALPEGELQEAKRTRHEERGSAVFSMCQLSTDERYYDSIVDGQLVRRDVDSLGPRRVGERYIGRGILPPVGPKHLPFRVVLADDHTLLRQSLRLLLERRSEVVIVGEAENGHQAVALAESLDPDVVLMDISMPVLNGIEATRQISRLATFTRVIIVSAYSERQQIVDALRAGAMGYLVKRSDVDELVLAIKMVSNGNSYFSAELAGAMDMSDLMVEARSGSPHTTADSLTSREKEVVQMLAEGLTCRAASEKLVLSEKTVEGHCAKAMTKLGVKTRADLVRAAVRFGMVDLRDDAGY